MNIYIHIKNEGTLNWIAILSSSLLIHKFIAYMIVYSSISIPGHGFLTIYLAFTLWLLVSIMDSYYIVFVCQYNGKFKFDGIVRMTKTK